MNTPDFSSITLAKAIPAPAHQGNPNHNLTNGQFAAAPAYSTQISNLEEANAYWEKHFVDKGRHHHIECRFGTKSYRFTVKFARNHSFTKNTNGKHGVKYDHLREFDIDRAKAMDAIWQVLRNPSVVNWSETDPRNKQFDKQLDFVSVRFGRVILSPTPTKDDIKAGKVSAFEFVSWHEPTRQQFSAAQKRMSNVRVTPTQMKKAHSDEQAFLLSRTSINLPKGSRAEVLPVSEGFPLDWTSCFQGSHSRNSFESDSLTGSGGIMVEPEQICKSIPTPAQAEAGNYAKRKMAWHSLTISIENEPGSIRCGIDPNGKAWKTKMIVPYGYINGSIGMDSDQIDIFFGSNSDADVVYLVNQLIPPSFAKVDEQKCMLNFSSEAAARAAYLKHYDDPRFLGPITAMPVAEFVEKARKANGRMVKSITLIFENGHEYELTKSQYSFDGSDELLKAEALGAGQRWITVHPNGKDGKGVPVMVQETQHGSGVFHVIGGAGGKLNYLKLRGLKPESSYKEYAAEKAKARRTGQKVQRARDKELGLDKAKGKAREEVKSQKVQADKSFIQKVAEKMGWKPADLEPNIPENVSDATQKKLAQQHHGELLKRANAAVELQHQNLLTDAMAREEAGGVSVEPDEHTPPDQLDISDLDDSRPQEKAGLGFAAHYAERAAENGADESVVKQEADAKKETRQAQMTDGQRAAIKTRGDVAQQVKSEIAAIREPVTTNVKAVLADAKDAVELIKAQKEWKATQKAASAANKDIDTATEVKAYNLEVSAVDDADIANELENDLRTIRTKAFLSAVGKDVPDPEKQLRQHISAGAFNSINALAVTAGGNALIDRSVVDVLGVEGAAQVLARRLHADLPADEMSKLTDGMEAFHLHHYMETSKDALQEAKDLHDAAAEIKLGDASHGGDFEAARELLHRRNEAVEHAHKILGTALGEMEANAALVTALKGGRSDKSMEVPLGKVSDEDAIRQVRAIGLQRGDYAIERVAGNQVLTITPEGLDRLAKPVDREELERTRNTLDILNGGQDEDDWLPQGFAKRPDLAMDLKPGVAETLAKPFKPSGDMQQSLKDYIGGRAADGDSPADIVADIQSSDFFQKSGNEGAYREALEAVAPLKGEDGKMARAESLTDSFNEYADSLVKREYGGKISTLQRQNFEPDHVAQDALHRALADHPEGISAYKPIGELTNDDQQALRKFFYANVAHESPEAASLRERLDSMAHTEPEKESEDMFGEVSVNPEWQDWKSQRDTLAEEVGSASLNWSKYTDAMGGHTSAYATMQDMIRSKVGKSFNENYNKLNPSAPLKMGRQVVRGNLNHLDAVDPKARAAREAKERELVDGLRERSQGKYASGSVSDKLDAAREQEEAFNQSQMGFFSTEQDDMFGGSGASDAPKVEKPLGADERYTLGHAAERTIASMMGTVGQNFKPGQPLKIFSPTMSGPDGVMRQRAIKIIAQNKRVILSASAGSGKTAMFLGSFSHLQSQGKVKKGVVICPSIVQGQVGAEALRFMEPGKYKWHCDPGCSFEDRLAAYKDPETHFSVVTHQSFRDDILKMAAMKSGEEPGAIADRMDGMTRKERADFTKAVLDHHGINFDFSAIDEGHGLLDRVGKDNSRMSNVIGGVTDNTGYTVSATADPVKNDISEAFSHLEKMDSARYNDRDAFMRRYGVDTQGSKDALKRELIRHVLPFKIEPKVRADKKEIQVEPSEAQSKALTELDKNIGKVRMARMEGKTDIEAMKSISPGQFKNAPESEHEAIAKELAGSLGIIKGSAVRAILDSSPDSAKIDALAKIATDRKGKPGVVFAHSLEAVENIKARLEKDGHRVMTLTGADSSEDKATKIRGFNPEKGDRTHDIIVCSDAGSTGANLQSGSWLTQFDTSQTAMVHAQRNARIHRIGQKQDIELMDLVANHPSERKARERLKTKYELRELMSSSMEGLDDTGLAYWLHQRKVAQQQESMF